MDKLHKNLELEREAYMQEHPSFRILGQNFICPDSAIDKICHDAKFISCVEDLNSVNVGAEIKSRFFRVIHSTLSVHALTQHHHIFHYHHLVPLTIMC